MKTKILIAAALCIGLVAAAGIHSGTKPAKLSSPANPKPDPFFDFVRGHRQGKGITLMWGSGATAATVSSFTVIRTYEDPTDPYAEWTPVGNCNCNSQRMYRSTDQNVSPGFVSYRVVATLTSGGYAYSDIETIHIMQR